MTFCPHKKAHLAKIEVLALLTVVSLVLDGHDLADIALIIVEKVLFGVGLEALELYPLIVCVGEGVRGDSRCELVTSLRGDID